MGRSKTAKFADNAANRYVLQPGKPLFDKLKGKWNKLYFHNDNDIVLELAWGRGEYTIGLARKFPDMNFVGVDIKGARIWAGSQQAEKENLLNAAFLRVHIQNLGDYFSNHEVSGLWIIHPDPRPKNSDERRRLTCPRFLEMYKQLIKPGGFLRLKTDNTGLYQYTMEVLQNRPDVHILNATDDLYNSTLLAEHYNIKTKYEQEFSAGGNMIKYIKFYFKGHL